MIRAVLFDCDGVLFDSSRANIQFFNKVLAELDWAPLDETGEHLVQSMSVHQLVDTLFADEDSRRLVRAAAGGVDYGPFYDLMQPVPDLHGVLDDLRRDYRIGLATNRGKTVHEVLRRFALEPLFEVALGVLDVPRPKPYPDMLEACLRHMGIAPQQAVYVGDQASDHEAAAAAGMHFVAVGELPRAARRIGRLEELRPLLAEL